jgi:hypothetical protein
MCDKTKLTVADRHRFDFHYELTGDAPHQQELTIWETTAKAQLLGRFILTEKGDDSYTVLDSLTRPVVLFDAKDEDHAWAYMQKCCVIAYLKTL